MDRYANRSGDSGVTHYEIGADFILVQFRRSDVYRYDYAMPGADHVECMKTLAVAGKGLATYISAHVRGSYASKIG